MSSIEPNELRLDESDSVTEQGHLFNINPRCPRTSQRKGALKCSSCNAIRTCGTLEIMRRLKKGDHSNSHRVRPSIGLRVKTLKRRANTMERKILETAESARRSLFRDIYDHINFNPCQMDSPTLSKTATRSSEGRELGILSQESQFPKGRYTLTGNQCSKI